MILMATVHVVQALLVVVYKSVYNVDGVPVKCHGVALNAKLMIWKAYDYAKEIPPNPWLQQLEAMASYCASDDVHVNVVVISNQWL